ncbi:prolipoprotein diacylglyceryl transferase [Candidatus Poribacteria bacterium]|nr:prolipoprotein diacylglyceryl transferase [Candidatus Poribacteria bacterium]MYH79520.1 prolipoprotein diacylglyceryl transferase [Candidatus Poribacteria bacterium]MYK93816.1 prolipoprotein diacylglyceryl transferase [Candidatus Poribacteria bacterium]
MYPTIIDFGHIGNFGPIGIHSYGLMLATAFITSTFVIQHELKRRGFVPDVAAIIVLVAAIGGVIGAKIYSALLDGQITFEELFSTAGLVWYGGFIGGCLGVLIVVLYSPNPTLPTIDIIGPTLLLGYGIGRIGCFLAGDGDYGPPSDLPWAMAFPNGTRPTDIPVHPTPIYETLISFTFFGILWSQRRKWEVVPGVLFGASLILLGVERFFVEFWRITPRVWGWMTGAQLFSIVAFIVGIVLIFWARSRPPVEAVAEAVAAEPTKQAPPSRKRRRRR